MRYTPALNEFDPEFEDPVNLVPERSRSVLRPVRKANWEYQKLLVNPFPLLLATVGWEIVAMALWRSRPTTAVPFMVVGVMACFFFTSRLFRYHCLDCDQTFAIKDWKLHICPGLLDRVRAQKQGAFRFPSAGLQTTIYQWLIYPVALLLMYFFLINLGLEAMSSR